MITLKKSAKILSTAIVGSSIAFFSGTSLFTIDNGRELFGLPPSPWFDLLAWISMISVTYVRIFTLAVSFWLGVKEEKFPKLIDRSQHRTWYIGMLAWISLLLLLLDSFGLYLEGALGTKTMVAVFVASKDVDATSAIIDKIISSCLFLCFCYFDLPHGQNNVYYLLKMFGPNNDYIQVAQQGPEHEDTDITADPPTPIKLDDRVLIKNILLCLGALISTWIFQFYLYENVIDFPSETLKRFITVAGASLDVNILFCTRFINSYRILQESGQVNNQGTPLNIASPMREIHLLCAFFYLAYTFISHLIATVSTGANHAMSFPERFGLGCIIGASGAWMEWTFTIRLLLLLGEKLFPRSEPRIHTSARATAEHEEIGLPMI